MTRAILTGLAAIAGAVALAGCGGGTAVGTTIGTTVATTSGVAGAQTTKASASFRIRVQSLEAQLQSAVTKFRNGNISGAVTVGGPLLTHCRSTVSSKLAPYANTNARRSAVSRLRLACKDMSNAVAKGASGNTSAAKQLAGQALSEAKQAVEQLG